MIIAVVSFIIIITLIYGFANFNGAMVNNDIDVISQKSDSDIIINDRDIEPTPLKSISNSESDNIAKGLEPSST